MSRGLYFYKLQSPYLEDVTKNCKLTINEIDSNFLALKDEDIKSAEFIRESKILVLTRNNGDKLIVPLSSMTYDLNVETNCSESGNTLTISYDGSGGKKTVVIDKLVTVDNLMSIIGSDILTSVITDGTLKGLGTIDSPLGINGVEKTGLYAPVKGKIDLTSGGQLPEIAKLGTRYVTVEYVNDYGYLYNGRGVAKITAHLDEEGKGWRIPTKADWDALLNSLEPCEYRNHNSTRCHVELGKVAGKYLKSECGWLGQPECECTSTKPLTGCSDNFGENDYTDDSEFDGMNSPRENDLTPYGVDKYGMTVLPTGVVTLNAYGNPQASGFKEQASFWSTTHVYNDYEQDVYVKNFVFNKGGVVQVAECPDPFYGVRLVKDYDGSNYFETEYIDGVVYNTILFPDSGQIWLASNYAKKEGFVLADGRNDKPEVALVNNGEILENRKAIFLNEWNGYYWEKKQLKEGDAVVIEDTCFDHGTESEIRYCWKINEYGEEECDTIVIEHEPKSNVEYRVYTTSGCNQELINTDDIAVERILKLILPVFIREKEERISADTALQEAIDLEREERISADTELQEAIDLEREERISADTELEEAIVTEMEERISADTELWEALEEEARKRESGDAEFVEALNAEISRAISAESMIRADLEVEIDRAQTAEQILSEAISAETAARIERDEELQDEIDAEEARAIEREDEIEVELNEEVERAKEVEEELDGQLIDTTIDYTFSPTTGLDIPNLSLKSKDGNPEHSINIMFDGSFGEI